MRKFVSGILLNEQSQILLITKNFSMLHIEEIWLLPTVEIKNNEDEELTLIREFNEEIGLDAQSCRFAIDIKRKKWSIKIFEVKVVQERMTQNLNKNNSSIQFYDVDHLPERMLLETKIGIIDFICKNKLPFKFYPDITESLFSSIYYTYLHPYFEKFKDLKNYKELDYIIHCVPLKKWKSCLPFVLSECDSVIKFESILSEILFAICTLLDDVCDSRIEKYKKDTVIKMFGYKQNISSVYIAIIDAYFFLQRKDEELSTIALSSLYNNAISQKNRFNNIDFHSLDEYCENSIRRSSFLGSIWVHSLNKANLNQESNLIKQIYPIFALLGQIMNDYYDIERNSIVEDLKENTISYHVLLLFREMRNKNREGEFFNCWSKKDQRKYKTLIMEFNVKEEILLKAKQLANEAIVVIDNSSIDKTKKQFLKHYIDLQFGKYIDLNIFNKDEKLADFNSIVNKLCFNIK